MLNGIAKAGHQSDLTILSKALASNHAGLDMNDWNSLPIFSTHKWNCMKKIWLIVLILLSFMAANAQPDEMFRGNPAHNKNYIATGNDSIFNKIAWSFKTGAAVRSTAIAINSNVYFGSNDGWLYALNKTSGALQWKYDCGSAISSSPAYSKGLIYVVNEQQELIALRAQNGTIVWKKKIGEYKWYDWAFDYYFPSPVISGDTLVVASADGKLLSLNKANGQVFWQTALPHFIRASPALMGGMIYIGDTNGDMYALHAATGKQEWVYKTNGSPWNNDTIGFDRKAILSSAAVDENTILFGSRDGFLYCLNKANGTLRWTFDHKVSWVISSPSIVNGNVITGTSDGHFVQSVNIQTGKENWRTYGNAPIWSSPLVSGNHVYACDNDGVVFCIDRETGKKETHPLVINAKIFSSPIISNNKMYLGADDGVFYCLQQEVIPKKSYDHFVYWDKQMGSVFLRNGVDVLVKNFLVRKGYTVISSEKLLQFVKEKRNNGDGNVIIFISSKLPGELLQTDSTNILHDFMQSGGVVADIGGNSLICDMDSSVNFSGFNYKRCAAINEIHYGENDLRSFGGFFSATATSAGKKMGVNSNWMATSPVDIREVDVVLGIDERGRASSWIKHIGKGNFIQLWIDQQFPCDYNFIDAVIANMELQLQ